MGPRRHFIWENRAYFTGISLFAHDGDKRYAQAPREAVTTEEDIAKWNKLRYQTVDYTKLSNAPTNQTQGNHRLRRGSCEIVHTG